MKSKYWFVLIALIFIFFTWEDHVYLTLNPNDKTYELTLYAFPFHGTYTETDIDYRLWYWAYPSGVIMEKTDSKQPYIKHIVNNVFRGVKLVQVDNLRILHGHTIYDPTAIIKFVPEKG